MKKAVRFTIDEALLRRIDRDPEVKRRGRSAFFRRAAEEYLQRHRATQIRADYQRGYASAPFPDAFGPWPPEGT